MHSSPVYIAVRCMAPDAGTDCNEAAQKFYSMVPVLYVTCQPQCVSRTICQSDTRSHLTRMKLVV